MRFWKRLQSTRKGSARQVQLSANAWQLDPLEIGQATDIGQARQTNEDALLTLKVLIGAEDERRTAALIVIADGMGGHSRGEEASRTAIQAAAAPIVREVILPPRPSAQGDVSGRPIHEILTDAIMSANKAVSEIGSGAGTTLTSVLVLGHSAHVAHVGDTRLYYLDDGGLQQVTQDHSLARRLVEMGHISTLEAQRHPQRNVLYRALGQGSDLTVDHYLQRLKADSYLVLCSDGLWSMVPEDEIVRVVRTSSSVQGACNRLVDAANERGGEDNITVVLARINY